MIKKRTLKSLVLFTGLLIIGAVIGLFMLRFYSAPHQPPEINGFLWPNSKAIMDFTTIDQNGNSFNVDDLYGKWSLIFFGYTHCPDVCPISLTVLEQFYNRVANKDVIQIIFVTVDPDRDTPARLKEYLEFFDPGFVGLGGTIDQITSLTDQIGIAYLYQLPQSDGNYLVDHTSSIFLFDQQAQLVSIFSAPHSVDEIYSRFSDIQNFLSTNK